MNFFHFGAATAGAGIPFIAVLTAADARHSRQLATLISKGTFDMSLQAMAHDENVVAKLRHALETVIGLPREHHEAIIHACRAAGLIPASYAGAEMHASAADAKKARLAKLSASMETPTGRSNVEMLRGILARGGVALDDVAGLDRVEIDRVFAGSRLNNVERMQVKSLLHRFGELA